MSVASEHTVRRSSRVPAKVPVRVTSLEPTPQFSEVCETLVVSAHGCALRFPVQLDAGSPLRLHNRGGQETTACVVFCQPMGSDGQGFRLGARLDRPENFWGLEPYPDDWKSVEAIAPARQQPRKKLATTMVQPPPAPSRASIEVLAKIEEQLSEDRLRRVLATLVRPLQEEVAELRERLASNAKRNRFEVSLGSIPPELEEKLWERLRQDLGTRVLQQAREQSVEMLGSTKVALEQKVDSALTEFRHRLSGELHSVEQRAHLLSKELTVAAQQNIRAGVEKLQQHALETRAHLHSHGEKLVASLQEQLTNSHDVHREEIQKIQAGSAAKASQLQSEVLSISRKISAMNESVRRLESGLDAHLESVAGEIVSASHAQLESAAAAALRDLQGRGSNEVETKVNEICGHLRTIQNRIEESFSGSLKIQEDEAILSIAQQFDQTAQQCTEKWRSALVRDLTAAASKLGEPLRQKLAPEAEPNS